jgi:hypothetical protein
MQEGAYRCRAGILLLNGGLSGIGDRLFHLMAQLSRSCYSYLGPRLKSLAQKGLSIAFANHYVCRLHQSLTSWSLDPWHSRSAVAGDQQEPYHTARSQDIEAHSR